jgi:shikimate kinase
MERTQQASDITGIIFLVGFMGSGKTTVGQHLAARLGGRFIDLDERIARAAGRSIPELFQTEGETGFRQREHAALVQVVRCTASRMTCSGISLPLGRNVSRWPENPELHSPDRMQCLASTVPFDILATRVVPDGRRPLWTSVDEARLRYEQRRADYAQADIRVPVGTAPPEQVAEDVLQALSAFQSASTSKSLTTQPGNSYE